MLEGERVPDCAACWKQEDNGGVSRRMIEIATFRDPGPKLLKLFRKPEAVIRNMKAEALENDFILRHGPSDVEVEVGNLCNLNCRMCSPTYSSKIENDPVHSKWYSDVKLNQQSVKATRFPTKIHWFKERAFLYGELFDQPEEIRKLTFKGGEPFASKDAIDVLDYLSKEGRPDKTEIHVVTNGTIAEPKLLGIVGKFKLLVVAVSLDGIGDLYEYIRYPAKWGAVAENMRAFDKQRNVTLMTSITFQAYNALRIVELFRFCDQFGYRINVSTLTYPLFLAATTLPPTARQAAANRLKEYAEADCKQENKANILALAGELEGAGDRLDVESLKQFMQFTNDLDQSRDQRFSDVNAELLGHIEGSGIPWTQETRFA